MFWWELYFLEFKFFRLLCVNVGRVLNQRVIVKKLGVSATAASKALVEMEKEGFVLIKGDEVMKLSLVELN